MKQLTILFAMTFLVMSCAENQTKKKDTAQKEDQFEPISNEILESSVIYEANIRQYSPGDFKCFYKRYSSAKKIRRESDLVNADLPNFNEKQKSNPRTFY